MSNRFYLGTQQLPLKVIRVPRVGNDTIDLTATNSTGGGGAFRNGHNIIKLDEVFARHDGWLNIIEIIPWVESCAAGCSLEFEIGGYRGQYGGYQRIAQVCGLVGTYVISARPGLFGADKSPQAVITDGRYLGTITVPTDYRNVTNINDGGGNNGVASLTFDAEGFHMISIHVKSGTEKYVGFAITGW